MIVSRGSDEEVAGVIRLGVANSAMPAFALPDGEIKQLVAFIRSLGIRAAELVVAGDRDLGKQIFFGKGRCSDCHMIRGQGGLLGPDLSNVGGDRTLAEIKQSILSPGLSEGTPYKAVTVVTLKGQRIAGTLRNRDNFSLQMMDTRGSLHFFSSEELREVLLQEKSSMPENYVKLLTETELQNLLAFLSRQTIAE
jgi:putative heme-binding domain-containing protein